MVYFSEQFVCDNCSAYNELCVEHLYTEDDCTSYREARRYERTCSGPTDSYPFLPGITPWRTFIVVK